MNFSREDDGYNKKEVDIALDRLKHEYEIKLEKKEGIIQSLERKVMKLQGIVDDYIQREEKTQKIMDSTYNIRKLEAQRLQLLSSKWNNTLNQIKSQIVPTASYKELDDLTQDFQYALKIVIDSSSQGEQDTTSYAQSVLSKMTGLIRTKPTYIRRTQKAPKKNVTRIIRDDNESTIIQLTTPSQAERFLEGDVTIIPKSLGVGKEIFSVPPKNTTKEEKSNGFSLEEALTPKESLSEIMMAFDLDD